MKTSLISDIHVKFNGNNSDILRAFLENPLVVNSEQVIFLGDIFDLFVGSHDEYRGVYTYFFNWLDLAIKKGKKVIFFEGNHDFNIKKIMESSCPGLKYCTKHEIQSLFGKKYYFSHGDDIEVGNYSYKFYRSLMRSTFIDGLSQAVPYSIIKLIGEKASKMSRERNVKKYTQESQSPEIRDNFRLGAKITALKYDLDFIICGHSHYLESTEIYDKKFYFNNGYCPVEKKFTYIDMSGPRLLDI